VKVLLAAGADINQVTDYGWSALLVATQNRYYKLGEFLLNHGADVNLANKGGWTPLYLATDNRNIESGDYPVRKPDMDHLDYIKLLLDKGANVNARMKDSTETRTVFTNQWLDENGATAFLRASQSGDLVLMKLLLAHGADPKIDTALHVTALQVAAGCRSGSRGPRRQARCPRLRQHRQPGQRQISRSYLAAGGLRRRAGSRRRAIGHPASRDRASHPQIDDGRRARSAAHGPDA
jgi:hypothetical protein